MVVVTSVSANRTRFKMGKRLRSRAATATCVAAVSSSAGDQHSTGLIA
jgi:hypothetical protein